MRIKRQRRKLRGKYSGNCLSCSAKWSKCWYIASVENQREWETRLSKIVTPCADEVCFQCWDAKIRTSPKRKVHYKAELIPVSDVNMDLNTDTSSRPSKRANRSSRRTTNRDLAQTATNPYVNSDSNSDEDYTDFTLRNDTDSLPINNKYNNKIRQRATHSNLHSSEELAESEFTNDRATSSNFFEEGIIFDEENAVFLLSTAFRTIPFSISNADVIAIDMDNSSFDDDLSDEFADDLDPSTKRGAYYCGKCAKLKKGHVCDVPSPILETLPTPTLTTSSSPSPSDLSPQFTLPRSNTISTQPPSQTTVPKSTFQVALSTVLAMS